MTAQLPFISAGASLAGGFAQARAAKTEAAQLDRVRRDEKIKGKQISASRREQRNEALATINALRASSGVDPDGPGSVNFRRHFRDRADENENTEILSSKNREETLKTQAALKRRSAPFSLLNGFVGAASSLSELIPES